MGNERAISIAVLNSFKPLDSEYLNAALNKALINFDKKIIVLDDDPTGVQTVHGISVYTDWQVDSIKAGFEEKSNLFFVLTNSRSFTSGKSRRIHEEIAHNILKAAHETGKDFMVISRSDSTLRGHYPLETQVLKEVIERDSEQRIDGEVICPFFKEGGRYTIDNIHYVAEGDMLVPAGQTEFARDKTFGYKSSHLGEWCEEKSSGTYKKSDMTYISLESLRAMDIDGIAGSLAKVEDFNKVLVNAVDYCDMKVFVLALLKAIGQGKRFMFRSAAGLVRVLSGVSHKPLLTADQLIREGDKNGGLIIVGSHVNKTTRQLEALKACPGVEFIEFNQHLVLDAAAIKKEVERTASLCSSLIKSGKTIAVYTRRDRIDLNTSDKEDELNLAVRISDAVTGIVESLDVRPAFIIAKGGITSSDIGIKALKVKKALVAGQIHPGIPVWVTGGESRYPGMAYVIFPGNVGTDETLRDIVETLGGGNT